MNRWARVVNGVVVETVELPSDWDANSHFNVEGVWLDCPEDVDQKWTYNGTTFSAPAVVAPSTDPAPGDTPLPATEVGPVDPEEAKVWVPEAV